MTFQTRFGTLYDLLIGFLKKEMSIHEEEKEKIEMIDKIEELGEVISSEKVNIIKKVKKKAYAEKTFEVKNGF